MEKPATGLTKKKQRRYKVPKSGMNRRLGTELTKLKVILCAHKLDTLDEAF